MFVFLFSSYRTLLYELMCEKFPFQGLSSHSVIWLSGNGQHDNVDKLKCSSTLKALIIQCWSMLPSHRPKFPSIVKQLLENIPLHRRHSTSEPEKLNKTGLVSSA